MKRAYLILGIGWFLLIVALLVLASYILVNMPTTPAAEPVSNGVTAPDPYANDLRLNGLLDLDVRETAPFYTQKMYKYPVICTIAPFARFHVGERDKMQPSYRYVWSDGGTCAGWAWLP